jgi:hypothetical protein
MIQPSYWSMADFIGKELLSLMLVVSIINDHLNIDTADETMYFVLEGEVEIRVDLVKKQLTDKDLKVLEQDLILKKLE